MSLRKTISNVSQFSLDYIELEKLFLQDKRIKAHFLDTDNIKGPMKNTDFFPHPSTNCCFVLLRAHLHQKIENHWMCLIRQTRTQFFDSYGLSIALMRKLLQAPFLPDFLQQNRVDMNRDRYQQLIKTESTCGEHAVARVRLGLTKTNTQYRKFFFSMVQKPHLSPDDIVTMLFMMFLYPRNISRRNAPQSKAKVRYTKNLKKFKL